MDRNQALSGGTAGGGLSGWGGVGGCKGKRISLVWPQLPCGEGTPQLQREDPSLKPQPFPPHPHPPSFPPPPLALSFYIAGTGWRAEGVLEHRGWRERALQEALGARPISGGTLQPENFRYICFYFRIHFLNNCLSVT